MRKRVDVVIVGAGVGGLVLALVLGRKGFRVSLLEHQRSLPKPFRGEILQPNGLKILDRIGLLQEVESRGVHRNILFHFFNTQGDRLLTIDYRLLPLPYNYALIALPEIIQQVLLEALAKESSVELCYGVNFNGMDRTGDRWIVPGRQGDRFLEWETAVVVGGDGVSSKVREGARISRRLYRYRDAYLTTVARRPPGFDQEGRYYVGKRTILGLFPVSKEQLYLFYLIPLAERSRFEARGIEGLRRAVLAIDSCMRGPLDEVTSWTQIGIMPCIRVRADSWVADGVALLGDAVHAMNPHVAQGRNQAMEDAMALGEVLEACFAKGDFSKAALYPYEERRRPQAECLQRLGDELSLVWNSGFGPLVWLRERIFRRIQENPRLQYTTLATVAGLHSKRYSLSDRLKAVGLFNDQKRQNGSGQGGKNGLE